MPHLELDLSPDIAAALDDGLPPRAPIGPHPTT